MSCRAYQNTVAGEISRFEGFTAKLMGDGVLAYFGWPQDARGRGRAGGAGRAGGGGSGRQTAQAPQASLWRLASASPPAWWSSAISSARARRRSRRWWATRRISRRGCRARPSPAWWSSPRRPAGCSAICSSCASSGRRRFKGIEEPVAAFAVLGERALESRFAARQSGGVAPIVGRDQELGAAARALAAGQERRRPGGPADRRGGDRQVADHRGAGRGRSPASRIS